MSRQEGKAADKANLASLSNRKAPTLVQQSYLFAAGTAAAAWHGASEPETVLPDTRSIANPQANGKTPDGTNFAERVIVPGGTPAMTPNPTAAGASPGVQEDTLTERALALGEDTSFADGESPPAGQRSVSHARPIASGAEAFMTSPFVPGLHLPYAFAAANQAKGNGSNGTTTSTNAALAGAASVSDAMREMVSLGAPPEFPIASRAAGQPPLIPILASRGKPVAPRGSTGMAAFGFRARSCGCGCPRSRFFNWTNDAGWGKRSR